MGTLSYWETELYGSADFIVIGAGFTGLQTAIQLKLKFPQKSVLIIEKKALGASASTRNAGFLCFGSPGEILAGLSQYPEAQMVNLIRKRYQGIRAIMEGEFSSEIDLQQNGGWEVFPDRNSFEAVADRIKEVASVFNEAGVPPESLQIRPMEGTGFYRRAFFNPSEAQINPAILHNALFRKAIRMDIRIISGTEVLGINSKGDTVIVETLNTGYSATTVCLCVNGYTADLLNDIPVTPARGQVLITHPSKFDFPDGSYHFDKGYIYFRKVKNRVLLGGARNRNETAETTKIEGNTSFIMNQLEEFLGKYVSPDQKCTIDQQWSGIMGMHSGHYPIVTKHARGVYVAAGLGGMGVALSSTVAGELVELVKGD